MFDVRWFPTLAEISAELESQLPFKAAQGVQNSLVLGSVSRCFDFEKKKRI